jgi:protein TonB
MKRNEEKVPEFDEIIFENRNKNYGAYILRKQYKSATSLSILGSVAFSVILMIALSFTIEEGTASTGPTSVILIMEDPVLIDPVPPPDVEPPAEKADIIQNLKPIVTDDTANITKYMPTIDELITGVKDGKVTDTDTVTYVEPTDPVLPPDNTPRIFVEEMPEYPGGNTELLKFIGENLRYPADAQENNIQGRVTLKFVVNPDGSVDRIEVIRGVDPSLDNEAIRVIKSLPDFKPGKQGGVPVPVWFTIPVVFQLRVN